MATEKKATKEKKTTAKEEEKPSWVKMKPAEVEKLIIETSKEEKTISKIGLILRDKHGIPRVKPIIGKKISQVLAENKIEAKSDEEIISRKVESLNTHIKKNKHDYSATRALTKKLWALKGSKKN